MKQILQALVCLHTHGMAHERLDLDTIYLSSEGRVLLGGIFPSRAVALALLDPHASFRIDTPRPFKDMRDLLTLMWVMLSGKARAKLPARLEEIVESVQFQRKDPMASALTRDVLEWMEEWDQGEEETAACYERVLEHSYFVVNSLNDALQDCLKKKRTVMKRIRNWNDQYEKKNGRKPTKQERNAHIQTLVIRAKTLKSQASTLRLQILDEENLNFDRVTPHVDPDASPRALSITTDPSDSDRSSAAGSPIGRSPAQQLFLATCEVSSPGSTKEETSSPTSTTGQRIAARRVMHRRKEIAQMIDTLQL